MLQQVRLALVLMLLGGFAVSAAAQSVAQRWVGRTAAESSPPQWPQSPRAPADAPNVIVIMTDDVGFGASSTFGGPVPTPTFDMLARRGLRYNRLQHDGDLLADARVFADGPQSAQCRRWLGDQSADWL